MVLAVAGLTVVVLVVLRVLAPVPPAVCGQLIGLSILGVLLQHLARGGLDTIKTLAFVAVLLGPLLGVPRLTDVDLLASFVEGIGLALLFAHWVTLL